MEQTEYILIVLVFNLFFILFMVAIISYMWQYNRKKKENEVLLQAEKDRHQKELFATQIEMQKRTMQEIGREIHDNVGQKLTLASLYIQQLIYTNKIPAEDESMNNVNSILNDSLNDLRQLSKSLSDDSIENNSLPELLKKEISKINSIIDSQLVIDNEGNYKSVDYHTKSVLIRICQEFIQNSLKYANCSLITITLSYENESIILSLSDNGTGFDINDKKSEGIGLKNMKKRSEIIGGEFSLSSDSNGTKIIIKLPITF